MYYVCTCEVYHVQTYDVNVYRGPVFNSPGTLREVVLYYGHRNIGSLRGE